MPAALDDGVNSAAGYFYAIDGPSVSTHTNVLFVRVKPPGEPVSTRG